MIVLSTNRINQITLGRLQMTKLQRLPLLSIRGQIQQIKRQLRIRGTDPDKLTKKEISMAGDILIAKGLVRGKI